MGRIGKRIIKKNINLSITSYGANFFQVNNDLLQFLILSVIMYSVGRNLLLLYIYCLIGVKKNVKMIFFQMERFGISPKMLRYQTVSPVWSMLRKKHTGISNVDNISTAFLIKKRKEKKNRKIRRKIIRCPLPLERNNIFFKISK